MISVIVPVYNIEAYLPRCLESLLAQTLEDLEIIVVNDGSTDGSLAILDAYSAAHPDRLVVLTKQNGGLSDARNFGLAHAHGNYIGFVDGDDWVAEDMFERMLEKAKSGPFDLVVCDVNYVYDHKSAEVSSQVPSDLLCEDDIRRNMTQAYPVVWNKLYRKELFETGIRFRENIWFEDFEFLYRLYPYIHSIGVVRSPLYQYRQQQNSITHRYNERLFQFITNFDTVFEFYYKQGLFERYKDELEYLYARYALIAFPRRLAKAHNLGFYRKGVAFALRAVKEHFPNYRRNSYLRQAKAKGYYIRSFNRITAYAVYLLEFWRT